MLQLFGSASAQGLRARPLPPLFLTLLFAPAVLQALGCICRLEPEASPMNCCASFFQYPAPMVLLLLALSGCTAAVQQAGPNPDIRLREYPNLHLVFGASSGSVSVNSVSDGNVSAAHLSSGEQHAVQALESLQFELIALGFNIVPDPARADAIANFSIGGVRYDPIAGWIADQAVLTFKDPRSGGVLAAFRAKSQFVTPTVENIVGNLTKAVKATF